MDVIVLIFFVVFIMAMSFSAGWNARERMAQRKIDQMLQNVQENIKEEISNLIHIKIEKHEEMLYVYGADNTFMAQGDSRKTLEDNLMKRYPGKRFAATKENLIEVGFDK